MEVLCGRGDVAHQHIVLRTEGEEPLDARARMFRALALIAMRQQHHESARLAPLLLAGADKLIYHDLRAVREIAELSLPEHQRQWVGHAVAELEAEHRIFA